MTNDATTAMDASSDAPSCATDAGGCTMVFSGDISKTLPCAVTVNETMYTDFLVIAANDGTVGASISCERVHPIPVTQLGGGCVAQVQTYVDGGVDRTWTQTSTAGNLVCTMPLGGFMDVKLANMTGGTEMLHVTF